MMPTRWPVILGLLGVVGFGGVGVASAQPADPAPRIASASAEGLSADDAGRLQQMLEDPSRRADLLRLLSALQKVLPPGAPVGAQLNQNTAATPPATVAPVAAPPLAAAPAAVAPKAAPAVVSTGLLYQFATEIPGWVGGLRGQLYSLGRIVSGIPAGWRWLMGMLTDHTQGKHLLDGGARLLLVLAGALAIAGTLHLLLRSRRARLGAFAATPELSHGATANVSKWNQRTLRSLRRILLGAGALLIDAVPVIAFATLAALLAEFIVDDSLDLGLTQRMMSAFVVFGAIHAVARALAAPDLPGLRILTLDDGAARRFVKWIDLLAGIAIFGLALLDVARALGLAAGAVGALKKLLMLVDHLLLVVIVIRNRHRVAARLRAPKRRSGVLAGFLGIFAETWHVIAIFLIIALWLVWAENWQGGYTRLWHFTATAIVVGGAARLIVGALLLGLQRLLQINDAHRLELPRARPGLAPRMAQYYPAIHFAITTIATILAVLVVLQISGIDALDWLFSSALGRQVISAAVAIVLTVCLAITAWEGANVAADRRLDMLSRHEDLGRMTRIRTLLPILRTVLAIGLIVLVGLTTLSQIGINIAPLLAGAGIIGVAIGFGSQKLVQDLITGIFLLLENAMQVGDFVTLAGVSGTVETLSIRTIRLRAGDGSVHIIPFSSVTAVNNTHRGIGNAAVSVTVSAREDTDAVAEVLKDIVTEMQQDPALKANILSDLQYWGVDQVNGASSVLVGQIVCTDGGRWGVQREFNRRYKKRFQELSIEIPTSTQTVLLRQPEAAKPQPEVDLDGAGTATVTNSPPTSSLGHSE